MCRTLLGGLIAVCLSGCMSASQNFNENKVSEIQKGVTTEGDLVRIFGEPSQRSRNGDGSSVLQWMYMESRVRGESFIPYAGAFLGGTDSANKTLVVSLGPNGRVTDFSVSSGGTETRHHTQETPE